MSKIDPRLSEPALLTALAFTRRAVAYSEEAEPSGSVLEDLVPYLQRVRPYLEENADGQVDVMPALGVLIVSLAQTSAVSFIHLERERAGRQVPVAELLERFDSYEAALVLDPERRES